MWVDIMANRSLFELWFEQQTLVSLPEITHPGLKQD